MKRIIQTITLLSILAVILLPTNIFAATYANAFGGTIRFEISNVSNSVKGDGNNVTNVNYNGGTSMYVWFSTWDHSTSTHNEIGKTLFYNFTDGTVNLKVKTKKGGGKYVLAANREHFGDPQKYISGTWRP